MKNLNPIQIWELQDLALAEINRLYKTLNRNYPTTTLSKIKNLQNAVQTLDAMADLAIKEEEKANV